MTADSYATKDDCPGVTRQESGSLTVDGAQMTLRPAQSTCPTAAPRAVGWRINEYNSLVLGGVIYSRPKTGVFQVFAGGGGPPGCVS